jgi:hypothetical protein
MALSDAKKVQTIINRAADEMTAIRAALVRFQATKALFMAANPDVTGTALEGNTATLNTALGLLQAEADKAIWTALIAARVPSHEGKAL